MQELPIRVHERMDFKQCQFLWYLRWYRGLVPTRRPYGALEFGTAIHAALAGWYTDLTQDLEKLFTRAHRQYETSPAAGKNAELGIALMRGYSARWGVEDRNADIDYFPELAVSFPVPTPRGNTIHTMRLDLVAVNHSTGCIWIMEHKTAGQVRTTHLAIDDQALTYAAIGVLAARAAIGHDYSNGGIVYNFIRKSVDTRPTDIIGRALNMDGTVSRRQSSPGFVRVPLYPTRMQRAEYRRRIRGEVFMILVYRNALRKRALDWRVNLTCTPTSMCPDRCDYFAPCKALAQQPETVEMILTNDYVREYPYDYGDEI